MDNQIKVEVYKADNGDIFYKHNLIYLNGSREENIEKIKNIAKNKFENGEFKKAFVKFPTKGSDRVKKIKDYYDENDDYLGSELIHIFPEFVKATDSIYIKNSIEEGQEEFIKYLFNFNR